MTLRKLEPNQSFKGKNGRLWLNGKEVGTVTDFEVKAVPEYEDNWIGGKKYREEQGVSYKGMYSAVKIDNEYTEMVMTAIKSGSTTNFTIVAVERSNYKETRCAVIGITFDDVTIVAFKQGESRKEDATFEAVDVDLLSMN